jgi:hypothetical protein
VGRDGVRDGGRDVVRDDNRDVGMDVGRDDKRDWFLRIMLSCSICSSRLNLFFKPPFLNNFIV